MSGLADAIGDPFDLILLAVKSYSLDEAMEQFAPAVGPKTAILPVINGMSHIDRLAARFGSDRVLGGWRSSARHWMPRDALCS